MSTLAQEQFKIVESDKLPISEPEIKAKTVQSEEKAEIKVNAKTETDGNLKDKKEETPVVVVGRFAIKKQPPKPVQPVQSETNLEEEAPKEDKDSREIGAEGVSSRGCQTDHEDHDDPNQITKRSTEEQRKEQPLNIIELKIRVYYYDF